MGTSRSFIRVHLELDKDFQTKKADTFPAKFRHAYSNRQQDIVVTVACKAVFCKYNKCYCSEVPYILSHFGGSFHYAKKFFKSTRQFFFISVGR